MPKPNMRFLRNIIKGTDSHNRALMAKEAAESKARLEDLDRTSEIKRKKTNPTARDIRSRQMGDIQAILGGTKRRRAEMEGSKNKKEDKGQPSTERQQARGRERRDKGGSSKHTTVEDEHGGGKRRRPSSRDDTEKLRRHHTSRSDHSGSHRSRRERNSSDDDATHRHSRKRGGRSKSPRRRRSDSPKERSRSDRHSHRHRSRRRGRDTPSPPPKEGDGQDLDPLDETIGPLPAPKVRGRGDTGFTSGIDRRFSESYDPKADTQMDGGDAINDGSNLPFSERQKMRQIQEERAIAAGVTLPRHVG